MDAPMLPLVFVTGDRCIVDTDHLVHSGFATGGLRIQRDGSLYRSNGVVIDTSDGSEFVLMILDALCPPYYGCEFIVSISQADAGPE